MKDNRYFTIGFDCGSYWNGIASVRGLHNAERLAAEIAAEYDATPEIRDVTPPENPWEYVVKGIARHDGGYGDYYRAGDERILAYTQSRKEAEEEKAGFRRTRGDDFTRIWIEKNTDDMPREW